MAPSHDGRLRHVLASALDHGIDGVLTTDAGLRGPCERTGLVDDHPVPASVLRKFSAFRMR